MKKLILASTIAMMCLSANVFAEDDGYGNDIPAARQEGTVDDGYGNKLPAADDEPEYKTYEEARSGSNGTATYGTSTYGNTSNGTASSDASTISYPSPVLNFGIHFGFGLGFLAGYPTNDLYTEYMGKKDDWDNYSFDIGLVVKYRVNDFVTVAPEVNLGIGLSMREIGSGYDWRYKEYKVNENRAFINMNIPLVVRVTPIPYLFVEAGGRLNFNLGTGHSNDYTDKDGNPYMVYDSDKGEYVKYSEEREEWKVRTFIPSLVAGIGGTFRANNHDIEIGVRFNYDLLGLEKDDKVDFYDEELGMFVTNDKNEKLVVTNETKWLSLQFYFNYYFL
jgi:hypothetical protein